MTLRSQIINTRETAKRIINTPSIFLRDFGFSKRTGVTAR